MSELAKTFNARTCELALGAGAMRSAGLKSITAKTLALSCSGLSLILELMTDIRLALAEMVPPERHALLLGAMDRVSGDLVRHRLEIQAKFVAIMRERCEILLLQIDF